MMRAGRMNKTITLERPTETLTATRAVVKNWILFSNTRAELVQRDAQELATGFGEAETGRLVFRIWWRPNINTALRVVYEGEFYNIREVIEIGQRRGLELHVSR